MWGKSVEGCLFFELWVSARPSLVGIVLLTAGLITLLPCSLSAPLFFPFFLCLLFSMVSVGVKGVTSHGANFWGFSLVHRHTHTQGHKHTPVVITSREAGWGGGRRTEGGRWRVKHGKPHSSAGFTFPFLLFYFVSCFFFDKLKENWKNMSKATSKLKYGPWETWSVDK